MLCTFSRRWTVRCILLNLTSGVNIKIYISTLPYEYSNDFVPSAAGSAVDWKEKQLVLGLGFQASVVWKQLKKIVLTHLNVVRLCCIFESKNGSDTPIGLTAVPSEVLCQVKYLKNSFSRRSVSPRNREIKSQCL